MTPAPSPLWLDLETYSEVPLAHGTYTYAENCEILIVAYAIGTGPAQDWDITSGEPIPHDLHQALIYAKHDPSGLAWAHNSMFDRNVLRLNRGKLRVEIPIEHWHCSMVQAHEHALPGALDDLCAVLGVAQDQRKLKIGNSLIHLFCHPRPKNSKLRRATRNTHPVEWALFREYARQDVVAMRECVRLMPSWNYPCNPLEMRLWFLDQRINDRGALVDLELAQAAVAVAAEEQKRLARNTNELTNGAVEATTQRDKLLLHILEDYGVKLENLRADTVENVLKRVDLPDDLRELLITRQQASQTSPAKYRALLKAVSFDGRLRGVLQHAGASRTRRWAGRKFQPQNLLRLPKYLKDVYDAAVGLVKRHSVHLFFSDVLEVLAALVRGAIIASPGKRLRVADLSNIEGRMLAWLAGEEWKLAAFRALDEGTGEDLYVLSYARAFSTPVEVVKTDERAGGTMRLLGKVSELALGYQGAAGAFQSMAEVYKIVIPALERVLEIVRNWRAANKRIVSFWYDLEDVVRYSIQNPGKAFACRRLKVQTDKGWLRIKLPSGGYLCYAHPRINEDGQISYMGINSYTRRWERIDTYGGKTAEQCTQAESRNLFGEALLRIDDSGEFDILLHTHDEAITENDENSPHTEEELCRLMTVVPPWASGLPLAAAGFSTGRYRKK